jgi:phytoene dehydrogenase-like protein
MTTIEEATMSSDRFDVVVVGAGVAGLVAGVETAKAGVRTLVLDAHAAGGRARTADRDGYLFNEGPHALYETGAFMTVLKRWGLEPPGRQPLAAEAHVLLDGHLHPLPAGPGRLARTPLLSPASRWRFGRFMTRLPRLDAARLAGRSVTDWFDDEDLPDDVRALVLSLVRVTSYSNAPDLMDAGAAASQLRAGLRGVRYVDGGWQRIVEGLVRALARSGGTLHAGTAVGAVESDGRTACVQAAYGPVEAATVILAGLPPAEAARLLGRDATAFGHLGPPVEASCLELGVTRPARPPVVFGIDRPLYLSVHAPVARLAPPGRAMVEVMQYLPPGHDRDASEDRDELAALASRCGLDGSTVERQRFLRRVTVSHALPLAVDGGLEGRPGVTATGIPNVLVAGDWVGSEGMLSDAAAASARAAAGSALRLLAASAPDDIPVAPQVMLR